MSEKPRVPTDIKAFNKALIEEFRAHRGELSGPMAGRQLVLLTTTGARSGEPRTVVIGYRQRNGELVVIASANGAPEDPAWYRNLQRRPQAMVELGADRFEVRARTVGADERDEYAKAVPYLESQQKLTRRQIPIVVLERTGA